MAGRDLDRTAQPDLSGVFEDSMLPTATSAYRHDSAEHALTAAWP